jgi:hypothetical protein
MIRHMLVDIETLSVRSLRPVIWSIGYTSFRTPPGADCTKYGPACIDKTESIYIRPNASDQVTRDIDPSTVNWLLDQDERIGADYQASLQVPMTLKQALRWLDDKWKAMSYIWAAPATYDIPILEQAYRDSGLVVPWDYRNIMCARTYVRAAGITRMKDPETNHSAWADSLRDADYVILAYNKLDTGFGA